MILNGKFSPCILLLFICACGSGSEQETIDPPQDPIDLIMNQVFEAHGELGHYDFIFRDDFYTFDITDSSFRYIKEVDLDSVFRKEFLTNDKYERYENGELLELSQEESDKYTASLNSVIYFTCLPLNLSDPAVNIEIKSDINIKEQNYDVIEVTFDAEGGGTDHEDIFYYWFNKETHIMDYLAYSYNVNGGGVRFREAYNSRIVGEMRFQDYVNYSAPAGTPLDSLPILFDQNQLEELSRIEIEKVYTN